MKKDYSWDMPRQIESGQTVVPDWAHLESLVLRQVTDAALSTWDATSQNNITAVREQLRLLITPQEIMHTFDFFSNSPRFQSVRHQCLVLREYGNEAELNMNDLRARLDTLIAECIETAKPESTDNTQIGDLKNIATETAA